MNQPLICAPAAAGRNRQASRGFTLIELLVVMGIIGVVLSMLLPSVGRARENARQVQCMSQIRQIGLAFVMYANGNDQVLPWAATGAVIRRDDWIYWEQSIGRDLQRSVIAPYMSQPLLPEYFQCPSDELTYRVRTPYGGFHFSYVMNSHLTIGGPSTPRGGNYLFRNVNIPAEKLMLYEEDEHTIDDGYGTPEPDAINLLAIRHDRRRQLPDTTSTGLTVNGDCRGNAAFCDGHVEYMSRNQLHTPRVYDPKEF